MDGIEIHSIKIKPGPQAMWGGPAPRVRILEISNGDAYGADVYEVRSPWGEPRRFRDEKAAREYAEEVATSR